MASRYYNEVREKFFPIFEVRPSGRCREAHIEGGGIAACPIPIFPPGVARVCMRLALQAVLMLGIGCNAMSAEWETLRKCRLLPNDSNDGDSFHVDYEGREYLFRLYFVDAPESDLSLPDRNDEQGTHFGIDPEQVPVIGKKATHFTAEALARPFTVVTKFQVVRGRSRLVRHLAFVETSEGQDLAALLVANGLARAFGVKSDVPDELSSESLMERYKHLEKLAARKQLGAYASAGDIEEKPARASRVPEAPSCSNHLIPSPVLQVPDMDPDFTAGLDLTLKSVLDLLPAVGFREGDYSEIPGWKPAPKNVAVSTKEKLPQGSSTTPSRLVGLNSASIEELDSLPEIGPARARAIIERRPFTCVEDLQSVPEIGPKRYSKIKPLVTIE
jgi:endonuclease YncB( thermonuclease family)